MRFEVTYSKMDEAIRNLGQVKTDMEKCKKRLRGIADSSLFDSGSLKDLNTSMTLLQFDVDMEVKECNTLIESLSNIRGIYGGMDKAGNGNGAVEGKNNKKKDVNRNNKGYLKDKVNNQSNPNIRETNDHNRPLGISSAQLWFSGGTPTQLNYGEDLIVVDSMDYLPMSDDMYNRLYVDQVYINEKPVYDKDGNPIFGLANLHNAQIAPEDYPYLQTWFNYAPIANIADMMGFTAGDLLVNYLDGNGQTYVYDASSLMMNNNIYQNYEDNLTSVMVSCEGNIPDGETVIIATSPSVNMTGCDGWSSIWGAITNPNAFASVNTAEAGVVCQVTREGDHYTMEYNYYIIDYYDFDDNPSDLYQSNLYGVAQNYVNYGKVSGTIEWDAGDY